MELNYHLFTMMIAVPHIALAAETTVIKDTIACNSIGIFALADQYYEKENDPEAAKQLIRNHASIGECTIIKKDTMVVFHHPTTIRDGDYGSRTTVRRKGSPSTWVIDKCSLAGRDPALEGMKFLLSEPPCDDK
jgi:hypothetical protein